MTGMYKYYSSFGNGGKRKKKKRSNYKLQGGLRYKVAINLYLIYYELNLTTCLEIDYYLAMQQCT